MKKIHLLYAFLALPNFAFADSHQVCESVTVNQSDNSQVAIAQKTFNDGFQELSIISQPSTDNEKVTRLSFAGSKRSACHFPSFALLKGGEWGWHVVWTSSANRGVFYARVDGEAWVSSLPKKLSHDLAERVIISETQGPLIITIRYPSNFNIHEQEFVSEDEGRSWEKRTP